MVSGTPAAQVRIPLTGPLLPPPHFCSHYTTWGKSYPAAEKLYGSSIFIRERQRKGAAGVREAGGGKIIRRRKNYPAAD